MFGRAKCGYRKTCEMAVCSGLRKLSSYATWPESKNTDFVMWIDNGNIEMVVSDRRRTDL